MRPRQVAGNGPLPFARAACPGFGAAAVVRVVPAADARPELVAMRGMPERRLLRSGMSLYTIQCSGICTLRHEKFHPETCHLTPSP